MQLNGAQGSQDCFISCTKDQMTSINYKENWPCYKSSCDAGGLSPHFKQGALEIKIFSYQGHVQIH